MKQYKKRWKERARTILAEYNGGQIPGVLTINGLAQQVSVTRQTLWRDEEIRLLYAATQAHLKDAKNCVRKNGNARIIDLQAQLEKARGENNRLIQTIIKAAQHMTEDALDPRLYFEDAST